MKAQALGPIEGRPFFCSWSGGKDSCLALYHAVRKGGRPECLFTMMTENNQSSRSHGLPQSLLEQQARQLGIPIVFRSATWDEYEATFSAGLHEFKAHGIEVGVFGDIDVESHRDWCVRVCNANGIRPCHPLWRRPRRELLKEFMDLQFKALIVVTKADKLGPKWLGRIIDQNTVSDLEKAGIDASGQLGEYHTVVVDGPIFTSEITLKTQESVLHGGYWFLKLSATKS
ncbi:MAG: diphthine--ammonia ligase [Desulfobacterales bacterium]|nr:MAG: diphthine--ammonia ligase [Desulfobacterales bacterium]